MRSSLPLSVGLLALLGLSACEPSLGQIPGDPSSMPGTGGLGQGPDVIGGSGGGGVKPPDLDELDGVDPETLPDGVAAQSRVPRLSYDEYDRSVSDLLLTQVSPSELFPAEQPNLGSFEDGGARGVNERLLQEIVLAAEQLSADAVQDGARYSAIVGCEPSAPSCRDTFIQGFGRRAYRRPLTSEEFARFVTLFDQGAELIQSGDAFRDGVQLVLESALQSAKFLYRAEQGSGQTDEAGTLLSGFEVATRLSFLFLGTTPDDELLNAAAAGTLDAPAGILEQAERLAMAPGVASRVIDFHDRWLQMAGLSAAEKDAAVFPEFNQELIGSMREELHAVVEEITLRRDGGIIELLTTPIAGVDAALASLYGLPGTFGETPTIVDLPADSGRAGLLTQAAFLTGHSSASTRTSPILRGVFVLEKVLCEEVPPPPAGAEMQEPETPPASDVLTTRDYFDWKTSMPSCNNCHSIINPVGFAFENFDGIGVYRTTDNGLPVNASGTVSIANSNLSFDDAVGFSQAVASVARVRACYAKNWLNYVYGRAETMGDSRTLARVSSGLAQAPFGARDLLLTLTTGAAFNHLPPLPN